MAIDQQTGTGNIRTNVYDAAVKGFAKAMYKFKQAVTISPTSAWNNFFYRENPTALSAQFGNSIKGIPRGAAFPQAVVEWERVQTVIEKYGLEDSISWEDILSNDVDVRDRTLFRIAEGVTKAVDDEIWLQLKDAVGGGANIQSFSLSANYQWNLSSAAIIDDLLRCKQLIAEQNYDTSNLMAFVSPKDYRSIMNYLAGKGAQFPNIGNQVASNGNMGSIVGIQLIVSNSVTASQALVVVPKICATWKELVPLQTTTIEEPYKHLTVRSVEMGVTQLTDPKAVVLIQGTQA